MCHIILLGDHFQLSTLLVEKASQFWVLQHGLRGHNETSKLEHLYAVTLAYLEQSLYDHVEDMNETTLAYLGQSVHDGHWRGIVFALLCAIFQ